MYYHQSVGQFPNRTASYLCLGSIFKLFNTVLLLHSIYVEPNMSVGSLSASQMVRLTQLVK